MMTDRSYELSMASNETNFFRLCKTAVLGQLRGTLSTRLVSDSCSIENIQENVNLFLRGRSVRMKIEDMKEVFLCAHDRPCIGTDPHQAVSEISVWLPFGSEPQGRRRAACFSQAASGGIDDKTNIACFAVFARRKNARSRATTESSDTAYCHSTSRPTMVMSSKLPGSIFLRLVSAAKLSSISTTGCSISARKSS